MHLQLLTPEAQVFDGEVDAVTLPGSEQMGSFEIRNNHAPIISSLREGKLTIRHKEGVTNYLIQSGFVEVADNHVSVVVEGINGDYKQEDIK